MFRDVGDFWMNLQTAYELDLARQQIGKAIQRIPKRSEAPAGTRLGSSHNLEVAAQSRHCR